MATDKIAGLRFIMSADNRRLIATMKQTEARMRKFQGLAMSAAGALGAGFGGYQVVQGIRTAIKSISDFEFQLSKVKAISGATNEQFEKLKNNALELGASTKFTATQIGGLETELARLGFGTTQILNMTSAISDLAIVADEDLASSARVVAVTLNAFQLAASESDRVANTMAESFSKSALDLEKFSSSMSNVAASAKIAGFSLEQTTAFLGVLIDNGIDASKAGTDLRRIFTELSLQGLTLNEALEMINNSGNKSNTAFKLFGQRAKDAGIILANNIPRFEEFAGQLADGNKQLQAMVNIMEDNLHTDLIKLTSAWDGMIQKGGVLTPILRGIVQEFTNLIKFGTMTGMPGGAVIIAKGKADEIEAATKKYKEQQLALRRIENTVQAAFDSGNVEAYIKALDSTIGKEEIIAEIRRRQKALRDEELTIADQELQNLIARGDEWKKLYDFAQLTEEINKRMIDSHIVFSPEEIKAVTDELTKYELSIEGLLEDYPMMTELTEEQTEALAESLRILKLLNEEKERQSELEKLNIRLAQIAIQGYIDMMHTVSQMRKSGEKDWKAYAKAIVNSIRKVIIALVAEYIAMQIGKAIEKSKTWYGALIQSGLAAAATATTLDALIPSFAQGGAVFGPTLAMVGDNPGASHDPEIIAPLSQLSGGMGGITVNFYGPTNPREAAQEIEDLLNRHGFNKNR